MNEINPIASRRRLLLLAAASVAGALPLFARSSDDGHAGAASVPFELAQTGLKARVVIVGGGMAGATAAKYLRLWGGPGIDVTLVEPNASYASGIMSNLVLNGSRSAASLNFGYAGLAANYGVTVRQARVSAIDTAARTVALSDGGSLSYDRLVLAPGVEFIDAYGLTQADYASRTPHAWQAGAQTTLLAQQLQAMDAAGSFVMTIPKAPYRCPPGPYERACLVADYLKSRFGVGAAPRVVVLDENPAIQAEVHTFTQAFDVIHQGVVQYMPGASAIQIDPATKSVAYRDAAGTQRTVQAQVVNPIPPHRASGSDGGWLAAAGLNNSADGRWCVVDLLSYESSAVPGVHVIGDAASCGMPKAGHVANQEAKICADAILRLLGAGQPDPSPVANSACYSPITASTASWMTVVYQYDAASRRMLPAANGGVTAGAAPTESASINWSNFEQMHTWFNTLMGDSFA